MTKEGAKAQWKGLELEKLDQAVYLLDANSKIKTLQIRAVDAILSALGKWPLQILKATTVHNTRDGIEVHIKAGETRINILQPVNNERMMDVVWLALEHGAPLLPDASSLERYKTRKRREAEDAQLAALRDTRLKTRREAEDAQKCRVRRISALCLVPLRDLLMMLMTSFNTNQRFLTCVLSMLQSSASMQCADTEKGSEQSPRAANRGALLACIFATFLYQRLCQCSIYYFLASCSQRVALRRHTSSRTIQDHRVSHRLILTS